MTTYKGIRGLTIQTVAGDPDPLTTGDIWYSSTTKKIRGAKLGAGAWASGGTVNTAVKGSAGAGTQTAAIKAGGPSVNAETYDGSSWTEVANIGTTGNDFGTGDSGDSGELAIAIAGSPPSGGGTRGTEEWTVGASVETVAFD